MTLGREEILAEVRRIVSEVAEVDADEVLPDQNIFTELGVDSLDAVAIFLDLHKRFGTSRPRERAVIEPLSTVNKLVDFVISEVG